MTATQVWLNGLIGAAIGGFSVIIGGSAVTIVNPTMAIPNRQLLILSLWQAAVGALLYLKQHPTPWDGTERRKASSNEKMPIV